MASISDIKIINNNNVEHLVVPFTEYYHDTNQLSYKRWSLKNTLQNWCEGTWKSQDLVFEIFSSGKSCLSGKIIINEKQVALNWRVKLLDKNKNELFNVKFAPIQFNNLKFGKAKKIRFEKRSNTIDLLLISKVAYILIQPK